MSGSRRARGDRGAVAAVAAAGFVLAVVLALAPLYASSVGSAALQRQLAANCNFDHGIGLWSVHPLANDPTRAALRAVAAGVADTEPAVLIWWASPAAVQIDGRDSAVTLLHQDGYAGEVEVVSGSATAPSDTGGALVPELLVATRHVAVGDTLDLVLGAQTVAVPVTGVYRDLYGYRVPAPWCAQRTFLRPNRFGDPPPPAVLLDLAAAARVSAAAPARTTGDALLLAPRRTGLTLARAQRLQAGFDAAVLQSERLSGGPDPAAGRGGGGGGALRRSTETLPFVITRSRTILRYVTATIAPVRWGAGVVGTLVVAMAGALLARRRRTELTLLSVRGVGPLRIGLLAGLGVLPALAAGGGAGLVLARVLAPLLGPSADLEPTAVRDAAVLAVVAVLVAWAVLVAVVAAAARRLVDRRPATARHRRWPVELVVVALTAFAAVRLAHRGGVQLLGATTTPIDRWALAAPLLALAAVVVVLVRPAIWLLGRPRRHARRQSAAGVALLVGRRRLQADRTLVAATAATTAIAVAAAVYASIATHAGQQALADKSRTFAGATARFTVRSGSPIPPALAGRSTVVLRTIGGYAGATSVVVLGIDPATFADVAYWRSDLVNGRLTDVLRRLGAPDPRGAAEGAAGEIPALVAGDALTGPVRLADGTELAVRAVGRASAGPGLPGNTTGIFVDRTALAASGAGTSEEIWTTAPVAEARDGLRTAGVPVLLETSADGAFDATAFLAISWSFRALQALAVLAAAVLVAIELSAIDARRRSRQLGAFLTGRMGMGARARLGALAVELLAPLAAGAVVGAVAAIGTAAFTIRRLDTIASVAPPAAVAGVTAALVPAVIGLVALALGTVGWGWRASVPRDPLELLRG